MTPEQAKAAWASMSEEERLAMAKAAPEVAGPWIHFTLDGLRYSDRFAAHTEHHAHVSERRDGTAIVDIGHSPVEEAESFEAGIARADARLIAEGLVLE